MQDSTAGRPRSASSVTVTNDEALRESFIQQELQQRVHSYTKQRQLRLWVGSYNVAGNACNTSQPLQDWLPPNNAGEEVDLVVVNLQEIVPLTSTNLLLDHTAYIQWDLVISKLLNSSQSGVKYQQLTVKWQVGLCTLAYIRCDLFSAVSDLQTLNVATGFSGYTGNKGAIVVHLNVFDSSVCLINAHLAAHQHNTAARNSDYHTICSKAKFVTQPRGNHSSQHPSYRVMHLFDHDVVLFAGDLNYRIDVVADLGTIEDLYRHIDDRAYAKLRPFDQLHQVQLHKQAFTEFTESAIEFPPTYKYIEGTSQYDRRPEKKVRIPSYTDRILYADRATLQARRHLHALNRRQPARSVAQQSSDGSAVVSRIQPVEYQSVTSLTLSDHKPIYATFTVTVDQVDEVALLQARVAINKMLDDAENSSQPIVQLSANDLHFGDAIIYNQPVTQQFTITNSGSNRASWYLTAIDADTNPDAAYCQTFVTITPAYGLLLPTQSQTVTVTVHITKAHSLQLARGELKIDDILILRLKNGRDHFLTLNGKYQPALLGLDLQTLAAQSKQTNAKQGDKVPQPIVMLTTHLANDYHTLEDPHLFGAATQTLPPLNLLAALSQRHAISSDCTPTDVASALVYILQSLAEPIVPPRILQSVVEATKRQAPISDGVPSLQQLYHNLQLALQQQCPINYVTLLYLINFFQLVLQHKEQNRCTVESLTILLEPIVFASHAPADELHDDGSLPDRSTTPNESQLLHYMLTTPAKPGSH